jgi:hypothetical protein
MWIHCSLASSPRRPLRLQLSSALGGITHMKTFRVVLKDGREFCVSAETYRHDGQQYVFDAPGEAEVQFFCDDQVAGIFIVPPDISLPVESEDI